jgi:hypothetical protein
MRAATLQSDRLITREILQLFYPTTGVLTETGQAPVQLNVVDNNQFDSKWSKKVIKYATNGKVGCALQLRQ